MNGFDYVFSLFGLLLGLSLTEMLAGFSRVVGAREHIRIGWLTPLLGLLIITDLVSFWSNAWEMHDVIPGGFASLMVAALIASIYFLAASLVFPRRPADWPDLDDWFMKHRRQIVGGVALANGVMLASMAVIVPGMFTDLSQDIVPALFYSVAAGLMIASDKRLLAALLVLDLSFYWLFRYL